MTRRVEHNPGDRGSISGPVHQAYSLAVSPKQGCSLLVVFELTRLSTRLVSLCDDPGGSTELLTFLCKFNSDSTHLSQICVESKVTHFQRRVKDDSFSELSLN